MVVGQKSNTHEPQTISFESAAIDITTGYAADDFLVTRKPSEPWAKKCFVTLVDAAVNHQTFVYPHPTRVSADTDPGQILPPLMTALRNSELIVPHTTVVASDLEVSTEKLEMALMSFRAFALSHLNELSDWIRFHFHPKRKNKHLLQLPEDVQPFIQGFWSHSELARRLADDLGLPAPHARYAFDVFFRGQQYYEILNGTDSLFFIHPIRSKLFEDDARTDYVIENQWSWGGIVAHLIENEQFSDQPDEVCDLIGRIRKEVLSEATWYQTMSAKDRHDKEAAIAARLGLPARIRDYVVDAIELVFTTVGAGIDSVLGTWGLVTLAVNLGFIMLDLKERYVPGKIGKVAILRAALIWPESRSDALPKR